MESIKYTLLEFVEKKVNSCMTVKGKNTKGMAQKLFLYKVTQRLIPIENLIKWISGDMIFNLCEIFYLNF